MMAECDFDPFTYVPDTNTQDFLSKRNASFKKWGPQKSFYFIFLGEGPPSPLKLSLIELFLPPFLSLLLLSLHAPYTQTGVLLLNIWHLVSILLCCFTSNSLSDPQFPRLCCNNSRFDFVNILSTFYICISCSCHGYLPPNISFYFLP